MHAAFLFLACISFQDAGELIGQLLAAIDRADGREAERLVEKLASLNNGPAVKGLMKAVEVARAKEPALKAALDKLTKRREQLTPNPPSTPIPVDQFNELKRVQEEEAAAHEQFQSVGKVRPAILRAVKSFTSADAGEELIRQLGSPDPEVREAALDGLRNVKGSEIEQQIEKTLVSRAKSEKDAAVRAGLIDGIRVRRLKTPGAIEALRAALKSNDWPVVLSAALAIKDLDLRAEIGGVIESVKGKDGRLKFALNDLLKQMTGYDYQDYDGWKAWLEQFGEAFAAGTYARPKSSGEGGAIATASFFGVPIVSKALCFVMDRSGSMADPGKWRRKVTTGDVGAGGLGEPKGTRKIDIARFELKFALSKLADGTVFNVIVYDHEFQVMSPAPIKLTAATRQQAYDFIDGVEPAGATNIYDSVEKAFEFGPAPRQNAKKALNGIDTIMLLSDGMPNRGKYTAGPDILRGIEDLNRNLKIQIDTVYVGEGRDPGANLLKEIAEANHGRFVSFD